MRPVRRDVLEWLTTIGGGVPPPLGPPFPPQTPLPPPPPPLPFFEADRLKILFRAFGTKRI